ncbi:hypothetical protein QBC46DRAFT_167247 [Diplogelasinospora grovesii]|uniref:Uncharacterized protein n=1 Tax=Diplogelasinospora grovesii TaxID=303347 RepID=A0AAN6N3F0_9PEZI|nr:hypothetical protein QBC46DRAFT_167247 [Diplogelasinospora grovesii]
MFLRCSRSLPLQRRLGTLLSYPLGCAAYPRGEVKCRRRCSGDFRTSLTGKWLVKEEVAEVTYSAVKITITRPTYSRL